MWEYVIVGSLVLGAAAYVVWKIARGISGRTCGCDDAVCSRRSAAPGRLERLGKRHEVIELGIDSRPGDE